MAGVGGWKVMWTGGCLQVCASDLLNVLYLSDANSKKQRAASVALGEMSKVLCEY